MKKVIINTVLIGIFLIFSSSKTNKVLQFYKENKSDIQLIKQLLQNKLKQDNLLDITIDMVSDQNLGDIYITYNVNRNVKIYVTSTFSGRIIGNADSKGQRNVNEKANKLTDSNMVAIIQFFSKHRFELIEASLDYTYFGMYKFSMLESYRDKRTWISLDPYFYGIYFRNEPIKYTIRGDYKIPKGNKFCYWLADIDSNTILVK
jgi:hypothetical protein